MTKRRTPNARLTSEKERKKQHVIRSVVKRRSQLSWRSVSRWMMRLVKLLMLAGVVAGVYWGATEGYRRLFWENPDYALREVQFTTDGSITREQAMATAGLVRDRNIFSFDLNKAREALKGMPQVDSVEIRRYLPNRIELTIKERKAVAWVSSLPGSAAAKVERTHLIDATGMVFRPKKIIPEYQPLPIIYGVDLDDVPKGKAVRIAEAVAALQLIQRVRETGALQPKSIDVSKGYCMVVTNQRGTQVTFGLDDLDGQLWRLAQVEKEAASMGQDLKTVNVMVVRNVPVTFMPPREPEIDYEELLRDPKDVPRPRVINAAPEGGKGGKPAGNPRNPEPSKPKESARPESGPLLKPFRRASA